jgi:putative ABC transport system permease protein
MIKFLLKGLLRDKSRSRLPVIVVAIGVTLTVFMHAYITGFMGDTMEMNARFSYGHVKVMTRAFADDADMNPNDLAILNTQELLDELNTQFPDMEWAPRIVFGGLVDAPDQTGETRAQGPPWLWVLICYHHTRGKLNDWDWKNHCAAEHSPHHQEKFLSAMNLL